MSRYAKWPDLSSVWGEVSSESSTFREALIRKWSPVHKILMDLVRERGMITTFYVKGKELSIKDAFVDPSPTTFVGNYQWLLGNSAAYSNLQEAAAYFLHILVLKKAVDHLITLHPGTHGRYLMGGMVTSDAFQQDVHRQTQIIVNNFVGEFIGHYDVDPEKTNPTSGEFPETCKYQSLVTRTKPDVFRPKFRAPLFLKLFRKSVSESSP